MYKLQKKHLIIIISALAAILLALLAVILLIKSPKVPASLGSESISDEAQNVIKPVPEPLQKLEITSTTQAVVSTTEPTYTFAGTSNPKQPLTLNGNSVEREDNGTFAITVNLNVGDNTFSFVNGEQTASFTVKYRYVILNSYLPKTNQTYLSGSTFGVNVNARIGSTVYATFNGQTIQLTPKTVSADANESTFIDYIGSFVLPSDNITDLNLGKVSFKATKNGMTETASSAKITCKKSDFIVDYDPNATPLGGKYINVGSGLIAEVVDYEAESFDAYSTNDMSRPTNNYLPKGTVDYCASGLVYDSKNEKEYAVLRYGKQIYTNKKVIPGNTKVQVTKRYMGTLPNHNQINIYSLEIKDNHTIITFDTNWKAPFYFDLREQSYSNPTVQDYSITNQTYNFIDITFCYSNALSGNLEFLDDHPLFKKAEIIQNQSDYTLRLHLKKTGAFYGWNSYYNENNQLVFEFLNPVQVTTADNEYGVDLTGAKILIDVGHGGKDGGSVSGRYTEAERNLSLANKIKAELTALGATVYMTRTTDVNSSNHEKVKLLRDLKPDFCIAIHHNSNPYASPNGFDSLYSTPFSMKAADFIKMHTENQGIYKKHKLGWHYYFMARSTVCPVVLTENGFMSNSYDLNNIISETVNINKAKAITKGIVDYFISIKS